MSVAFIGLITALAGIWGLSRGREALFLLLAIAAVLGAASAVTVGAANIPPGHLLLGFVAIGLASDREAMDDFLAQFGPEKPGIWLAALTLYGVIGAIFIPQLLAGATMIVPLGTTSYGDTGSTVPLTTVSSNLTQSLYMIANVVCFGVTAALASSPSGLSAVLKGLLAYCVANLLFAFADLATYYTGTQSLLSFIRNANYTLHVDDEIAGMKRIVGSFTEASSFARTTLGAFGFLTTLWLAGYRPYFTGIMAALSAVALIGSTSSTGMAGLPVMLLVVFLTGIHFALRDRISGSGLLAVTLAPLLIVLFVLYLALDEQMSRRIYDYVDLVVLNKASSDSGIERSSWNAIGLQNFYDSNGLGVGLGTVRTSSFLVALLAGLGVPGTLFYVVFLVRSFVNRNPRDDQWRETVQTAARNGCLGLLVGDLVISPTVDQGLFFYMLAATGAALTAPYPQRLKTSPLGALP